MLRWTQLHTACEYRDVQCVCELIELGWPGSVNARARDGYSPLMCASFRGDTGIVQALLAAGADVHAAKLSGATVLSFARSRPAVEAMLRSRGAADA